MDSIIIPIEAPASAEKQKVSKYGNNCLIIDTWKKVKQAATIIC